VSWWRAEGNAQDSAGGNNNGALQGGATFAPGKFGQAFALNGTTAFVQIPPADHLYPHLGSFSLTAWVKTTQATGTQVIVSRYDCGGSCVPNVSNSLYQLYVHNGHLAGNVRDTHGQGPSNMGGGQILEGTTPLADGAFHLVAMVRDQSTSQLRLYVDGMPEASAPLNAGATGEIKQDAAATKPLLIGAIMVAGQTTEQNFFNGLIDEAQYYSGALSDADMQTLYSGPSICVPFGAMATSTPA
jgi:hypothetical protein